MKRSRHPLIQLLGAALAVAGLVSCSTPEPAPKPPEKCNLQIVSAAVITSKYINPSENGEPRPVQVRLYQLKSDVSFLNSDFEEVWKDDKKALGEDLVKSEEFPVYPNTRTEVKFERDASAQFLVGAALFRNPTGKKWYKSFELPPPPGAGACGAQCPNGECEKKAEQNPAFYLWIDGTSVDDGIEYADYQPEGGSLAAQPLAEEGDK
jgi:type VI secretion system protein VasD